MHGPVIFWRRPARGLSMEEEGCWNLSNSADRMNKPEAELWLPPAFFLVSLSLAGRAGDTEATGKQRSRSLFSLVDSA
jgi:hypothetical protein